MRRSAISLVLTLLVACTGGAGSKSSSTSTVRSSVSRGTSTSIISGTLVAVGGVVASPRPLPGTVRSSGHDGESTYRVSDDGRFSVEVPVGRYLVTGRSPLYQSGRQDCVPAHSPVVVAPGDTVVVDVMCFEK